MSEEHQEVVAPAPKPKRQNRHRVAAKPAKQPSEYDGITTHNCCFGCSEKHCVITGSNVCGHPFKASHPGADTNVLRRIEVVKKLLRIQKIEAA